MNSPLRLSAELWAALLASPKGSIQIQEEGRRAEIRLLPTPSAETLPEPLPRTARVPKASLETNPEVATIQQRLRTIDIGLLLDLDAPNPEIPTSHPGLGPGLAGPLRYSEELPSLFSRRNPTPANPATLRTMLERLEKAEIGAAQVADIDDLLAAPTPSLFPNLPPSSPLIPPLPPLSSLSSPPLSSSSPSSDLPVVQGLVVESFDSKYPASNGDLFAPETQDVILHPLMLAASAQVSLPRPAETALIRPADIHLALSLLFARLSVSLSHAAGLLTPEEKLIDLLSFAQKVDITHLLSRRLPICESLFSPPSLRLIGKYKDGNFALIAHHYERIHFEPIPPDGGHLHLAVLGDEPIFTREEISQFSLLSPNAPTEGRSPRKTSPHPSRSGAITHAPLLDSATQAQARSRQALHALPVDAAFLQRLAESLASPTLWDHSQEGLAVLKDSIASLYEGELHLLEGLLVCLKDRRQVVVFDRKNKRSIPLHISSRQRIWLQKGTYGA